MKKVVFYTKYARNGASSRLRTLQYLDAFGDEVGVSEVQPLFDESYIAKLYQRKRISKFYILKRYIKRLVHVVFSSTNFDHIHIEKELLPYFPAFLERLIKGKYSVDYDDAIFHNYDQHRLGLIRMILGGKIASVMKYAHTVVVGNQYLEDYARNTGSKNILRVPTVVSQERYSVEANRSNNKTIIGWIGTPNTQKYIHDLFPILDELSTEYNFKVHLIGANKNLIPDHKFDLEVIDWTEESEVGSLADLDIGLMPLPDLPFEKGKCGYKLIQYMALGKAVVASPVGVNTDLVISGKNGLLADNPDDWRKALSQILASSELQVEMGRSGRDMFQEGYSLESQKDKFLSLFRH